MAANPQQFVSDWFDKTAETTEAALAMTAKYLQESMWWWAEMMGGANSIEEWQKRAQMVASEAIPLARKSAEQYLKAMDQIYQRELALLRDSLSSDEPRSIPQPRIESFWESTFAALRVNTQNFIRANSKAMESWAELVRKSGAAVSAAQPAPVPEHANA
jgi:hypothetical protein